MNYVNTRNFPVFFLSPDLLSFYFSVTYPRYFSSPPSFPPLPLSIPLPFSRSRLSFQFPLPTSTSTLSLHDPRDRQWVATFCNFRPRAGLAILLFLFLVSLQCFSLSLLSFFILPPAPLSCFYFGTPEG